LHLVALQPLLIHDPKQTRGKKEDPHFGVKSANNLKRGNFSLAMWILLFALLFRSAFPLVLIRVRQGGIGFRI